MTNFLNPNLFDDNEKSPMAGSIATVIGIILLLFSAVTSFAFFAEYASGVFNFISPALSPWLAGLVGVISFEGMSFIWRYLHANHADTERAMRLAQAGSVLSLAGGLLVTVIYFALQTDLIRGNMDQQTITTLSLIGGLLIIIGVSANFGLYHFYSEALSAHQANLQRNQINAMRNSASYHTRQATTQATLRQTMDNINQQLPAASARQAQHESAIWRSAMFTNGEEIPASPPQRERIPANSKKLTENSKQNPYEEERPSSNGHGPK
jgi:hypothetical protein